MEQFYRSIVQKSISKLSPDYSGEVEVEVPQNHGHGDLSTNAAMRLTKELKKNPRQIATDIVAGLEYDPALVTKVDIAGPGFINITFSDHYFHIELASILSQGSSYGRTLLHKNEKVNLEWVSANPTGNLHAGHGRQVCLGAAVANLLEWVGYDVVREYYFNNAGNQMRNLANSVRARYLDALGDAVEFPEDGYHGQEIRDAAEKMKSEFGDSKRNEDISFFQKYGEEFNFANIKKTLDRLGVHHDIFFNEQSLYDSGAVEKTIAELRDKGLAYDKDGAVWLKLSEMGMEQDRVIVKSTGEPTYRLPDICYHKDKLSRGYSLVIDIFGADHIATIPDVLATVKALGLEIDKVKVIIHQMVSFVSGGELIKFSKRTGQNYLLDELIDDVGVDAVKYFFNMRAPGSHLEFDVRLAQEQSDKNPVYYVQYAHARIASILRFAEQQEINISNLASVDLSPLVHQEELALIKLLRQFPQLISRSAESFAPHHVCEYLRQVSAQYHKFYHDCRIVGQPEPLQSARLALCLAAKQVLANGCMILGITAPESM
jgi:arginyl-tRNA synthetase